MPQFRNRFVVLCRQGLACAVVVLLVAPAAGVATLDLVGPTPSHRSPGPSDTATKAAGSLVAAEPVRPSVAQVLLTAQVGRTRQVSALTEDATALRPADVSADPEAQGEVASPKAAARSTPQPVHGYATVGVTWSAGHSFEDDEIAVSVRSLDDGTWSQWQELPYDAEHGPDPGSPEAMGSRLGTDALVVGDVDEVQVRAVTSELALPTGMSLDIVDPGEPSAMTREQAAIDTAKLAAADSAVITDAGASAGFSDEPAHTTGSRAGVDAAALLGSPANVTPKPQIFSRAQWGADERMRDKGSLRYFEAHAGFVHHTVNANNYTRAQVPSILRGIYAYHTQSLGWSDVGYNFLVDRFGRIWEGRYGGVARPVVGAHTLGYNDYAFAMSAIGNFETVQPRAAMLNAYGRLFAWKLSLHGIDARSRRQQVGDRTLKAVSGHRDAGQTACPGRYLYAKIGAIRRIAAGYQRPFTARQKDTDISGSRWPDLVVRNRRTKAVSVVRTEGQIGFERRRVAASGSRDVDLQVSSRDLTGDGRADVLARKRTTKVSVIRPGNGAGRFGAAVAATKRFQGLDQMVAVGDFDGDGHNDIVGRQARSKRLMLIPGRGNGRFKDGRLLAERWSAYNLTAAAGDLDNDGDQDLLARGMKGRLWLVRGTGKGAIAAPKALPGSWEGFDIIAGFGDVTNDGRTDVVARKRTSQTTWFYPGNGRGGLGKRLGPFDRFHDVDFLASPGQAAGSRRPDLVGRNGSGQLVVFTNKGTRNIGRTVPTGDTFTNTDLILSVGDWNGDGRNDVMTRRTSDGAMVFRAGIRGSGFASPVVAGTGWGSVRLLAGVGDLTGDGYPDVMGQPAGGAMRVYPSNGRRGFKASFVARAGISSTRQIGAGLWTGDGSPDSIIRRGDGSLLVYRGNGPGGLTGRAVKIGSRARRYDWMVGAGNVDGRGGSDLMARERTTGDLWLLPGGARWTLGTRRLIGSGFGRYDLLG